MTILWQEQTQAGVPEGPDWLSPWEAKRLERMRFPARRDSWRLGRWTAKCAVSAFLGLPRDVGSFPELEIRAEPSGAPQVFLGGRAAGVSISLSHRGGVGVCAVAPPFAALGCDLELAEPHSEAFFADYFTAEEQELVSGAAGGGRMLLLSLLWSAKESLLKALGLGLRVDLREVVATPVPPFTGSGADWRPLRARYGGTALDGWWNAKTGFVRTLLTAPRPLGGTEPEILRKDAGLFEEAGRPEPLVSVTPRVYDLNRCVSSSSPSCSAFRPARSG